MDKQTGSCSWESPRYALRNSTTRKPVRTVAPTFEPITLEEAKLHLRVTDDSEDEAINNLIQFARELVEADTSSAVCSSTWTYKLDDWPTGNAIELPLRPIQSVSSITYLDTAGATQTWSSSNYTLDTGRVTPAIFLAYLAEWPTIRPIENAVTVTVTAGYATAAAVPQVFKQLVLLAMSREYGDREGVMQRTEAMGYERLLLRVMRSSYP
jgi:uncharacterized phiE125 gp8 family phage protein